MSLREMLKAKGLRLIQYGYSSAGKSVRASEATRWGRVQLHDFDAKSQNLAMWLNTNAPDRLDKIDVIGYTDLKTDAAKAERFLAEIKKLAAKPGDIKTVVIDSYTRFEDIYLGYLMSKVQLSSTGFGSARVTTKLGDENFVLPGTMDSSLLASGMKKLMGWLKDLNLNIILNAHVRAPMENRGQITDEGTLAARGQCRDFLPTEFTEFHRLFVDSNGKHRVQARATAEFLASTVLANVPPNGILLDNSLALFDNVAIKVEADAPAVAPAPKKP